MDVHLGVGYEFNAEGHQCRRDVINRLYKVDEFDERIISRSSTCLLTLIVKLGGGFSVLKTGLSGTWT